MYHSEKVSCFWRVYLIVVVVFVFVIVDCYHWWWYFIAICSSCLQQCNTLPEILGFAGKTHTAMAFGRWLWLLPPAAVQSARLHGITIHNIGTWIKRVLQHWRVSTVTSCVYRTESFLKIYIWSVTHLVQKFLEFYGISRFVISFTRVCHWPLSWTHWVQSTHPETYFVKNNYNIIFSSMEV